MRAPPGSPAPRPYNRLDRTINSAGDEAGEEPKGGADIRLYRGLKEPFKPEKQPVGLNGTDFTDCPWSALAYARGVKGVLLVMDLPAEGGPRVSEELWPNRSASRLMVWGRSEQWITTIIAAKHLRAYIKRSRMSTCSDESKGRVLAQYIDRLLEEHDRGLRPDPDDVLIEVCGGDESIDTDGVQSDHSPPEPSDQTTGPERVETPRAVTEFFAGVPVSDFKPTLAWYERLMGKPPDFFPHEREAVWRVTEHAWIYVVADSERAGKAFLTILVTDLDDQVAQLAVRGLEPTKRETYGNGVRKVTYRDPDGNEIGFGQPPS